MNMDDVFEKLQKLQEILSQKIQAEQEKQEIPKLLNTHEELLTRLKEKFIDDNQKCQKEKALVRDFRSLLAEAESNREKAEKNMDAINTQREYEALDKEIRDASEKEQQYRKDLQAHERELAELEKQMQESEALIAQQEADLVERREGIEREIAAKNKEIEELKVLENEITEGSNPLDPDVRFKFERIIRNKKEGIVAIKGQVCMGCHMILPAQFANDVRKGEDIVFCPYCSRILYYEESQGEDEEYFNDEDAGSLSDLEENYLDEDDDFEEEEEEEDKENIDFED
jgi:predicted  nucleic acid-binding Zn-ribbon protein